MTTKQLALYSITITIYCTGTGFTKKDSESTPSSSSSTSPVSLEIEAQEYMAIDSYAAQGPGQINFEEGEIITVLDKLEDGKGF